MDNYMPDWNDDVDFEEFLNLPPDDVDQGGEDGSGSPTNTPSTPPGSYGTSNAPQNTDSHSGANNVSSEAGYKTDNPYADTVDAGGCLRPACTTGLKTAGSDVIAREGCEEACIMAPNPQQPRSSAPDLPKDPSSQKGCTCISCCKISNSTMFPYPCECRFPSCNAEFYYYSDLHAHERSHYGQPGKYTCVEPNCHVVTKNFGDLKRHDKAKHCTNPDKERFPCPVPWCKYSGNNGFARKDKFKSHYKNMHEGKPGPAKAGRVIKPVPLRPKTSRVGPGADKQQG